MGCDSHDVRRQRLRDYVAWGTLPQFFLIATLILVFTIGLPLSILARRY